MSAGEHAHGEEFPRHETVDLVGAAMRSEQKRWRIQVALVALGVTVLVLGLPTRSLGSLRMEQIWPTARGEWTGLHLVPALCARALTVITGWRPFEAWYVVSALATGCTAAVLLNMARRHGATALRAIFLTLLALAIPMAWLAATIPNASSCELLGAAWLFSALDRERDERWTRRSTIAFVGAALLHAWNIYLWPAYLFALLHRHRGHRRGANISLALVALVIVPAIVLGAWRIEHRVEGWPGYQYDWWRAMLASGSGGWGPLVAWFLVWTIGLGVGTFGILRLLFVTFREPQRRPPVWMFVFALVPLTVLGLGGFIGFDVPWLWLVPIAFLGFLDGKFLPAWILIALSAAGIVCMRAVNSGNDWYNLVVFNLRPDDLVVASDIVHQNALAGLKVDAVVVDLIRPTNYADGEAGRRMIAEHIEQARAAHRRIVIDVREPKIAFGDGGEWIRLDGPAVQSLRDQGAVDLIDLAR